MHKQMLYGVGQQRVHDEYHEAPLQKAHPLSPGLVRGQKVLAVICSEVVSREDCATNKTTTMAPGDSMTKVQVSTSLLRVVAP
jgi:hypothetical protein